MKRRPAHSTNKYDTMITNRDMPFYRKRKLLFLLSWGMLAVHQLWLFPSLRVGLPVLALIALVVAAQLLDRRKQEWTHGAVAMRCVLAFFLSAVLCARWGTPLHWAVWAAEGALAALLAWRLPGEWYVKK